MAKHPATKTLLLLLLCISSGCAADYNAGPPPGDMGPGADMGATVDLAATPDLGPPISFLQVGYPVGAGPRALAVGDLDGDQLPDVVTANAFDDSITVLRNTGMARLQAGVRVPVCRNPSAVALGDLDGQKGQDVLVSCPATGKIHVLLNQGGGVFPMDQGLLQDAGEGPGAMALLDVDAQRGPDVLVLRTDGDKLGLLLHQGAGALSSPAEFQTTRFPFAILAADILGDGRPTAAVAGAGGDLVALLQAAQPGVLSTVRVLQVGQAPVAVAASDVDRDSRLDLLTANYGDDTFSVLQQRTPNGFIRTVYGTATRPIGIAVGSFNADTLPDVAVLSQGQALVQLHLGVGQGTFATGTSAALAGRPAALAAADLDRDGVTEILVLLQSAEGGAGLWVLRSSASPVGDMR